MNTDVSPANLYGAQAGLARTLLRRRSAFACAGSAGPSRSGTGTVREAAAGAARRTTCAASGEFKVADGKGRAQERDYADKYRRPGVPVHLIGREERNIVGFETV